MATALFANSPFTDGRPNGYQSYRAEMWRDTDPDRSGLLPFAFDDGMGFERYVDYALDVPMYFVYRDGRYIDVAGASFRDFLAGKLAALPGMRPTVDDWADHLTTLFPDVRLKRFLEMRGADAGSFAQIAALPALWTGLLYDQTALDGALALTRDWTVAEMQALRDAVPRQGFGAVPWRHRARCRRHHGATRPVRIEAPRPAHAPGRGRKQGAGPADRDRRGGALAVRPPARRLSRALAEATSTRSSTPRRFKSGITSETRA